jgi:predicted metal-dependent hydrolase
MWGFRRIRRRVVRRRAPTKRYIEHKEAARALVHARLEALNAHYGFAYNRVAIKDARSRWGSCSQKKNLNFNYRLVFLPAHLVDYIVVHELCHLKEFNHGPSFWTLVAEVVPEYKACIRELKGIRMR